jgi:hypothetical protein
MPSVPRHDIARGGVHANPNSFLQPLHVDSFLHSTAGTDGIRNTSDNVGDIVSGVGSSVWGDIRSGDVGPSSLPTSGSIELSSSGLSSIPILPRLWGTTSPNSFVDDRVPIFASSNVMHQQQPLHQQQQQQQQQSIISFASEEETVLKSLALDL